MSGGVEMITENSKSNIYRVLNTKGFGLPQVQCAERVIEDEINDEYFKDSIAVCSNCPLGSCSAKTIGRGPITSPLMIVGSNPSDVDEETGLPLTGLDGYFLTMALQTLAVDRRAVYITNVLKCNTMSSPSPDEIATCRPYLEYELNRLKPQVIIALGDVALKSLTNHFEASVGNVRGGQFMTPSGIAIFPTWHPSYVLNQNGVNYIEKRNHFINDLYGAITYVKSKNPGYRWVL